MQPAGDTTAEGPSDQPQRNAEGSSNQPQQNAPGPRRSARAWAAARHWIQANAFTPPWLPAQWQHPRTGYLVAVLLQAVAVAVMVLLAAVSVGSAFPSLLSTLVVALIALAWGAGPGLIAALTGAVLLTGLLISSVLHLEETTAGRVVALGLYLAVGGVLSALAGQSVQARRDAQNRAQREAEAAARLATTIEAMADGIVVYDRDEHVVQINSALRTLLALDQRPNAAAHVVQERSSLLLPRDAQGRPLPLEHGAVRRVLRGEVLTGPDAVDLRVRALDGRELEVSVSGAPIRDQEGGLHGGVLVVRDVTERRRLEREVAERARHLETTLQTMVDGVFVYDREGRIMYANAAAYGLHGLERMSDFFARPVQDRLSVLAMRDAQGQPLPSERVPLRRVLQGEIVTGADAADVRLRTPDGRECEVSISGAPLRDPEGRISGAIMVVRDVTERRRLERQAREALQERDRLRVDFIATVSHDLQTPLTAIRAGLGLLEASVGPGLPPEAQELLAALRRSAERLRVQIADLLVVNRLEAGGLRPDRTPLDLRTVVQEAVADVQPLLQEKNQTVAVELLASLPVVGDARLLEHLLVNLLANAYRHTPPGTRITISGHTTREDVRLVVQDTGPGIPTAEVEAIFERFHRLDNAAGGSGLGLAIARRIVEVHGGRLWAESPPGGGAAFHIALPHLATPQKENSHEP